MLGHLKNTANSIPLLTRFIVLIAVPIAIAAWQLQSKLKSDLPKEHMVLIVPGTTEQVSIDRDEQGVPSINAKTDAGAYFAVGYVHAQDRLWQLEFQRRITQGRLSEIFGKESLPQDIWFRTLGLYSAAKSAWPGLSKEAQASLSAYAAGVNAGIAARKSLPVEFQILNTTPQPWTEIDSIAWIKMFAFDLGGNFRTEISRFIAQQSLPPEILGDFFPDYPLDAPTTIAMLGSSPKNAEGMRDMSAFQKDMEQKFGLGGRAVGSNAWVVSGKMTKDGNAFLANDPHLGLQIPSLWYTLSVNGKNLHTAGMSLVGLPLVIFGHNEKIAWGGTSMMADVQDLFLERSIGTEPNFYEDDGAKRAFAVHTEEIDIRADFPEQFHKKYQPHKIYVRETRHGPVISDQFRVFDQAVSLRWTALDANDTSYEAFYRLNFSQDWPSFKSALHLLVAPALNVVYADREGNIGYVGAGRIPIRGTGDGSVPAPGWDSKYDWIGAIPAESMPEAFNPESGFIVTANNKVIGTEYPYFISKDWAPPARAQRIQQILNEKILTAIPLSLNDMRQIQQDTLDLEAQKLMKVLAGFSPRNEEQEKAWSYLKTWNGDMAANSQAAAIFQEWMRQFKDQLFSRTLKSFWKTTDQGNYQANLGNSITFDGLANILQQKHSQWCPEAQEANQMPCQAMLSSSLQSAIAEIYKLKGDHSMQTWKWGELQTTVYKHMPFSQIKPFDYLFERRIANGGSQNSVNVSATQFSEKEGYLQGFGPSFRQITSIGRAGVSTQYMNSTGQSGNPFSTHYADMVKPFNEGRYYFLETPQGDMDLPAPATHTADTKSGM